MPVFIRDAVKVLYIHVPKTGGNAIMKFFERSGFEVVFCDLSSTTHGLNALRTCSPQHYHAALLTKTLRIHSFTYIFMTVRHPIQRLKSEYLWRVRDPAGDPNEWALSSFANLQNDPYFLDNHLRPQHEFRIPEAEVFRMEDGYGQEWSDTISKRIDAPMHHDGVTRTHAAKDFAGRSSADVVFNDEVIKSAMQLYRQDFTLFGYSDERAH